ncbi:MAG: N-acetylmuramoyl-L-alanine amidase [Gammaproteobacteria bacterium]|nr:N-acetylmuramoyl-L-alanine amidase [Gammaproteobacteria bacterium]
MSNNLLSRRKLFKRIISLGVGFSFLFTQKNVFSQTKINAVRASETSPDHTRVVFDLSSSVKHSSIILESPNRLVLDLKNTKKIKPLFDSDLETAILRNIRSAPRGKDDLRVVLDLKQKSRPRIFTLDSESTSDGRLVIDLHATNLSPTPVKTNQEKHRPNKKQIVIAIDPGHGGKDPGAIGKKGTKEKDIVLSVGKKLQKIINRQDGYKAVMTRSSDKYIRLRNRVKKAREYQADFFVSLHADSYKSPKVEGSSVYALSINGASSEAARWMADKENASDLIGGVSLDDKDDLIASVLLDLTQTNTIQNSIELGNDVLMQLGKVGKVNKKKVQQAGFAVLKAPDMPSILVETAFLSNPKEEQRLRSSKHQAKLANAIFSGLKKHIKS